MPLKKKKKTNKKQNTKYKKKKKYKEKRQNETKTIQNELFLSLIRSRYDYLLFDMSKCGRIMAAACANSKWLIINFRSRSRFFWNNNYGKYGVVFLLNLNIDI